MANLKKLILTELSLMRDTYRTPSHEQAEQHFLEIHPDLRNADWKTGYFKYFWKQIYVENALDEITNPIAIACKKYTDEARQLSAQGTTTVVLPARIQNSDSVVQIRTVNTANIEIPEAMFARYLTNTIFDDIQSDEGGAMAACSVVVVGGPGVGKSTLMFWAASQYREIHPTASIAVVSSEMEIEDLLYEARKKPWMHKLDFILTSEYGDELKQALQKIFLGGYDIIILDSFADIVDKLRDFCGMTSNAAETWLLDLIKKAKGGRNDKNKYTLTFAIQQQTKSGSFAGTNKLKHNTTAMLELRREKNGDRYMLFTKNRRCGQYVGKRMFYFLGNNNQVSFDSAKWEREISSDDTTTGTAIGQTQENMNQTAIAGFEEMNAEAAERARLLLDQAEIHIDGEGNPVLADGTPVVLAPHVPRPDGGMIDGPAGNDGEMEDDNDIYYDETTHQWVGEDDNNRPVFGATRDAVVEQLNS